MAPPVIFTPKYFLGKDIIIDLVSVIVLLLIAVFATRYYKLNKSRNYFFLASSFYLLALSFILKIAFNFTIYYQILHTQPVSSMGGVQVILKSSEAFQISGLFFYRLIALLGLFTLYSIYEKQSKANIGLMIFFIIISVFFSKEEYYIYHLTSFIFLAIISNRYYQNYKKIRKISTGMLAISFIIIALSQISFMFFQFNKRFYVWGEILQLIGYILLLVTFMRVLKHGREKK